MNENTSPDRKENADRLAHLITAAAYFTVWIVNAYFMFKDIQGGGGISHIAYATQTGNYLPVILISMSIVFFALFLKSLFLYLIPENQRTNK